MEEPHRLVAIVAAALALAGCGGQKTAPPLRPVAPAYPGATDPRTTHNDTFDATDWTLPKGTRPSIVYDWYTRTLTARGWKVTQRNETGLRAEKGSRALSIGVRRATLEAIRR